MERYYPSNENFLYGKVDIVDYYGYIYHGFALVEKGGLNYYVSYDFNKSLLMIPQAPEADELFRKKSEEGSNISLLIKLLSKLKFIQVHYGDDAEVKERVNTELKREEYKGTVDSFNTTINYLVNRMFPKL